MRHNTIARGYTERRVVKARFELVVPPQVRPDEEGDMRKDDFLYCCGFCGTYVSPDLLGIRCSCKKNGGYYGNICEECRKVLAEIINKPREERVKDAR